MNRGVDAARPQPVRAAHDAGKKVKGHKRHIVADTGGLLVGAPKRRRSGR